MKTFLDTSVLVATFYGDHEHHEDSLALFRGLTRAEAGTAAHCLVEFYAVVTGMPGQNRASPDEALLFMEGVHERMTIIALDDREYIALLTDAAEANVCGGTCYDALIARCAVNAGAEAIYTWNVQHFKRLGGHIAERVSLPR